MPRVRFTVRRMMVVVAMVAIVLCVRREYARMGALCLDYQLRAIDHEIAARIYSGREVHLLGEPRRRTPGRLRSTPA